MTSYHGQLLVSDHRKSNLMEMLWLKYEPLPPTVSCVDAGGPTDSAMWGVSGDLERQGLAGRTRPLACHGKLPASTLFLFFLLPCIEHLFCLSSFMLFISVSVTAMKTEHSPINAKSWEGDPGSVFKKKFHWRLTALT